MTAHDHLKDAELLMGVGRRDFQEVQAHALIGILEHLIGTPEPPPPVFDEHPKMAPISTQQAADVRGVEIGRKYAENVGMTAQVLAGMGINPDATPETLGLDPDEPVKLWELDGTAKPILITVNLDGKFIDQKIATAQDGLIQTITDAINATNPPESKTRAEIRDEYENSKVSPTPSGLFTNMANGVGPEHASAAELGRKYAEDIAAGCSEILDAGNFAKATNPTQSVLETYVAKLLKAEKDSHASAFKKGLIQGAMYASNAVEEAIQAVVDRALKAAGDESETDEDVEE